MQNEVNATSAESQNNVPFWRGFQRFILFIVITTLAFTALAAAYAALRVKTVYTAQNTYMVVITVANDKGVETPNVSLNKKLMSDIKTLIYTSGTVKVANETYEGMLKEETGSEKTAEEYIKAYGGISAKNLNFSYNEESLVVKISYSGTSGVYDPKSLNEYVSDLKLKAYVSAAKSVISEANKLPVNVVVLKDLQNGSEMSESNSFWKYVLIGFAAGFVLSFAASVLIKALDSTVRMKEELESICGVAVLSCIEDISD